MQQVSGDVEEFIVEAVRKQLALPSQADDADVEASAAVDAGDEFPSSEEVQYYLNLPDVQAKWDLVRLPLSDDESLVPSVLRFKITGLVNNSLNKDNIIAQNLVHEPIVSFQ